MVGASASGPDRRGTYVTESAVRIAWSTASCGAKGGKAAGEIVADVGPAQ